MKRSLVFCAIALVVAVAQTASAIVNVQLNLRYNDPADTLAGGTWELLAGSDAGGIAGLNVLIDNINNDAVAAGSTGYDVFGSQQVGSVVEIVTGSDLAAPALDIGLGDTTTGNVADDLFPGNSPAEWANNALLASGTFGATRPAFLTTFLGTSGIPLTAGASDYVGSVATAATLNTSVRGDSVATDLLVPGDANRDGTVDGLDFSILSSNFNGAGTSWGEGDFNSDPATDGLDFSILSSNFNGSATPPTVVGVPEPTTALLALAGLAMMSVRRKR